MCEEQGWRLWRGDAEGAWGIRRGTRGARRGRDEERQLSIRFLHLAFEAGSLAETSPPCWASHECQAITARPRPLLAAQVSSNCGCRARGKKIKKIKKNVDVTRAEPRAATHEWAGPDRAVFCWEAAASPMLCLQEPSLPQPAPSTAQHRSGKGRAPPGSQPSASPAPQRRRLWA